MHLTVRLSRTEGSDPPYDHNFFLGSAVYSKLRELDAEVSTILHDSPHRTGYVLSEVHRVRGKPREAWFRLGTSSEAVARLAGRALAPGTEVRVGATVFQVMGLTLEEPIVRPGEFVTLSPILLWDKVTRRCLVHDSPGYREHLENAINAQLQNNAKLEGAVRVLHIEPQGVRRRTIRERVVLAQKAKILLDGSQEELRFLVNHGIGSSPGLGFGCVVPRVPLEQFLMLARTSTKGRNLKEERL